MKPKTRATSRYHCLFCLKPCSEATPLMEQVEIHGAVRCVELQKQLQQLFILRQLLDIPSTWCEEMLQRDDGDSNPESWFRICRTCTDTVKDAWNTYQKLLSILEKMGGLKEQIKEVMLENIYRTKRIIGGVDNEIRAIVFPEEMASLNNQDQSDLIELDDISSDFNPDSPINQDQDDDPWEENEDEEEMMNFSDVDEDGGDNIKILSTSSTSVSIRNRKRKKVSKSNGTYNPNRRIRKKGVRFWKICKLCPTRFKDEEDLEAHIMCHEENKKNGGKFDCQDCAFPAKDENDLEQHMFDKHLNPKFKVRVYNCSKCEFNTQTWKDLKTHAQEEHPDFTEEELGVELSCKVCVKTCENRSALMLHMKKTHPEAFGAEMETLECDQCSRRFPNKIVLQYHINSTHRRVTKYICDDCGKGFRYEKALLRHQVSHNKGKREFVCHICGCEYAYKSVLENHYRKFHPQTNSEGGAGDPSENDNGDNNASTPENFKCKYYELTSPFKVIIIRHMQTHKAELGHQCDICDKYYVNIQGLRRHKRINHPTTLEEHKCPYCFKSFNSLDYVRNHTAKYCKVKLLDEKAQTQSSAAGENVGMMMMVDHSPLKQEGFHPPEAVSMSMPLINAEVTQEFKASTATIM